MSARAALQELDASGTSDGKIAPHVAKERVTKLRTLARQLNVLADVAEHL